MAPLTSRQIYAQSTPLNRNAEKDPITERIDLTDVESPWEYIDDIFKDISLAALDGGAIYASKIDAGKLTLKGCQFLSCKINGETSGGALYIGEIKSFYCWSTSFEVCASNEGSCGAGTIYGIAECLSLRDCSHTDCLAKQFIGGMKLASFNSSAEDCLIPSACDSYCTTAGAGAVVGCTFTNCQANGPTGACGGLQISDVEEFTTFRHCIFDENFCSEKGGGLQLQHLGPNFADQVYLHGFFFVGNYLTNETQYGWDAYLDIDPKIEKTPFENSYTTHKDQKQWFCQPCDEAFQSIPDWLPMVPSTRYIAHEGGQPGPNCGFSETEACSSIYATLMEIQTKDNLTLMLDEGDHTSDKTMLEITEAQVNVEGKGIDKTILHLTDVHDASYFVLLQKAYFNVTNIAVHHFDSRVGFVKIAAMHVQGKEALILTNVLMKSNPDATRALPCIECHQGMVTIVNTVFEGYSFLAEGETYAALFSLTSADNINAELVLIDTNITALTQNSPHAAVFASPLSTTNETTLMSTGNIRMTRTRIETARAEQSPRGGALAVHFEYPFELQLSDCTFVSCAASGETGLGGAIYLSEGLLALEATFALTGLTFTDNTARLGAHFFAECSDLPAFLARFSTDFPQWVSREEGLMVGNDSLTFRSAAAIDLFYFSAIYKAHTVHVGRFGRSKDGYWCGRAGLACETVNHAVDHLLPKEAEIDNIIQIDTEGSTAEPVDVSDVSILPDPAQLHCSLIFNPHYTNTTHTETSLLINEAHLTVSTLVLTLFVPFDVEPAPTSLIVSRGDVAVLTLTELEYDVVAMGTSEIVACALVRVEGGSAALQKLRLIDTSHTHAPFLFSSTCTTIAVEDLTVAGIHVDHSNLILLLDTAEPEAARPLELTLKRCSCQRVSQKEVGAGVLMTPERWGTRAVIENCSFVECNSNDCRIGSVFFGLGRGGSLVVNGTTTFEKCMASTLTGYGGAMFLLLDEVPEPTSSSPVRMNDDPTPLFLTGLTFVKNDAKYGRDVFLQSASLTEKVRNEMIKIDFANPAYNLDNSITGGVAESGNYTDILTTFLQFKSSVIYVSNRKAAPVDSHFCGLQAMPCLELSVGAANLRVEPESVVYIEGGCEWWRSFTLHNAKIHGVSVDGTRAVISTHLEEVAPHAPAPTGADSELDGMTIHGMGQTKTDSLTGATFDGTVDITSVIFRIRSLTEEPKAEGTPLIVINSGTTMLTYVAFEPFSYYNPTTLPSSLIRVAGAEQTALGLHEVTVRRLSAFIPVFEFEGASVLECVDTAFTNITVASTQPILVRGRGAKSLAFRNVTAGLCEENWMQGGWIAIGNTPQVHFDTCIFSRERVAAQNSAASDDEEVNAEEMCSWNSSLIHLQDSEAMMTLVDVRNTTEGGVSLLRSKLVIGLWAFEGNTPSISKYPSIRRNIICAGESTLHVGKPRGGDGAIEGTSMWVISDKDCKLEGEAAERASAFFIPALVTASIPVTLPNTTDPVTATLLGSLLIPCDVSVAVRITFVNGTTTEKTTLPLTPVSENIATVALPREFVDKATENDTITACLLFGATEEAQRKESAWVVITRGTPIPTPPPPGPAPGPSKGASTTTLMYVVIAIGVVAFILLLVVVVLVVCVLRLNRSTFRRGADDTGGKYSINEPLLRGGDDA